MILSAAFSPHQKIWMPLLSYEAGMKRGFLKTWTFFLDVNSSSLLDEMSVGLSSRSGLRAMESFSKVPPPGENHFGCSYCLYRLVIFSEDKNRFSCRLPEVSQAFSQAPPIGMSECFPWEIDVRLLFHATSGRIEIHSLPLAFIDFFLPLLSGICWPLDVFTFFRFAVDDNH